MDAEDTQDGDKPSARVIPFTSPATPPASESPKGTSFEDYLDAIADAVKDSIYSKTAQADREALEDEYAFHRRFGFTVNRERRGKVLAFKHAADVTDREIRHLWRTANLDLNGEHARITSSLFIEVFGYCIMVMTGLLMMLAFWTALRIGQPTWKLLVALSVIELILAGLISLADWMYVRPNQIRRRIAQDRKS